MATSNSFLAFLAFFSPFQMQVFPDLVDQISQLHPNRCRLVFLASVLIEAFLKFVTSPVKDVFVPFVVGYGRQTHF
jgi:hypothetical protein